MHRKNAENVHGGAWIYGWGITLEGNTLVYWQRE